MRRRVVCPRSHPASPYLRRPLAGFALARSVFPGGYPPDPPVALSRWRPPAEAEALACWLGALAWWLGRWPPATPWGLATCGVMSWAGWLPAACCQRRRPAQWVGPGRAGRRYPRAGPRRYPGYR